MVEKNNQQIIRELNSHKLQLKLALENLMEVREEEEDLLYELEENGVYSSTLYDSISLAVDRLLEAEEIVEEAIRDLECATR